MQWPSGCHQGHNAAVLYDLQMICRLFAPFFLFSSSLTVLHLWLPKTPSSSMPSASSSLIKSPTKPANASLNLPLVNFTRLNQPTLSFIFFDLKGWGDSKPPDELKDKAHCKRVPEDERGELRKPKISYKFWEEKKTFFYWRLPSGWWTQGLVAFARKLHHIYQVSADKKLFSSNAKILFVGNAKSCVIWWQRAKLLLRMTLILARFIISWKNHMKFQFYIPNHFHFLDINWLGAHFTKQDPPPGWRWCSC